LHEPYLPSFGDDAVARRAVIGPKFILRVVWGDIALSGGGWAYIGSKLWGQAV